MEIGGPSPGVKWQGREAEHSPPTSAEVKKTWIYTATPPIHLHGAVPNWLRAGKNARSDIHVRDCDVAAWTALLRFTADQRPGVEDTETNTMDCLTS
jgi:hypothetical protein